MIMLGISDRGNARHERKTSGRADLTFLPRTYSAQRCLTVQGFAERLTRLYEQGSRR
jgi:hypothetical protein